TPLFLAVLRMQAVPFCIAVMSASVVVLGCRTFIGLDELLRLLSAVDSAVTLNGEKIGRNNVAKTIVYGGDSLVLPAMADKKINIKENSI
ncbi:MAG: hypothetical protein V1791_11440, partial [Pseudomonadota bacterium]